MSEQQSHTPTSSAAGAMRTGGSWWPALLAFVLQMIVLYAPSAGGGGSLPHADKVVHAAIFALPAFFAVVAGFSGTWTMTFLVGHAVLSEIIQSRLLPHRSGDPWDVLADLVGVTLGLLAARLVLTRRAERTPHQR